METFNSSEIALQLEKRLPNWQYDEALLKRSYKTQSWKSSLMLATTIAHLAEVAWHHPELRVSYSAVEVLLNTHSANGITELDFELAEKIEETVNWRPGEDSSLPGTPNDPKYGYLKL